MKKDYIYQDKGQYKLLQNATRIGGFVAGDQGIVPSERVLPEQKFAHQPIFRRPPEEPVTVFSYIHNFNQGVFSTTNHDIKVANLFKKFSTTNPAGVHLLYKYTGWADAPYLQGILLKNWSAEAKATKFWNGAPFGWVEIGNMYEGTTLTSNNFPVFFKNYVFFRASTSTDAIYYAKLNPKKTETKEVKVAIRVSGEEFSMLGWLYADNTDPDYGYKMVAYRTTNHLSSNPNYSENFMQYKAKGLEGPWVYDKIWDTYSPVYGSPGYTAVIQELATLILSKTHKELSMAILYGYFGWSWAYNDIRSEAYDPPYNLVNHGANILSRGGEGEIVRMFEGQASAKNYLIKRQGDGQMKKTLITDIDQGFKD